MLYRISLLRASKRHVSAHEPWTRLNLWARSFSTRILYPPTPNKSEIGLIEIDLTAVNVR
jgi:hypothetical protein